MSSAARGGHLLLTLSAASLRARLGNTLNIWMHIMCLPFFFKHSTWKEFTQDQEDYGAHRSFLKLLLFPTAPALPCPRKEAAAPAEDS